MNPQETQQVAVRDEKWVPSAERVKISSTNIRLETTMPQKESANKKCTVNAEVFKTILDICLRVEGLDFINVLDDDNALTFLIDLGYKGPLNRHTNKFVDHMHQPWRTLAAIINKCLSRKTASNDKLRNLITGKKRDQDETINASEESEPEPEPAKKKTFSKRRVKKKVTLSADDNIIFDDPDAALELAKSISQTKAEEA
ncbi:hypothetical protein Tco_1486696 [Tanacetum coccineum]